MTYSRTGAAITGAVGDTIPTGETLALIVNMAGTYTGWSGTLPPGVSIIETNSYGRMADHSISGTFTGGGSYSTRIGGSNGQRTIAWEIDGPVPPTEVTATAPHWDDDAHGYTIPEVDGVTYSEPSGWHPAPEDGGTVTITAEAASEEYVLTGPAEWSHTFSAPAVTVPAEVPVTRVPVATPVVVDLAPLLSGYAVEFIVDGTLPDGITAKPTAVGATSLAGTAGTAGDYPLQLQGSDEMGDYDGGALELTLRVAGPVQTIPVPAAERTEDGYMLPDVPGVIWTVDDVETLPGTYSVQPVTEETTVSILPVPDVGYAFATEPEPLVLTYEPAPGPDPDPEPGPWEPPARPEGDYPGPWPAPAGPEPSPDDESVWSALMDDDPQAMFVAGRLSERIIRHAGMDVADLDPAEVLTARDHAMTVLEYVKGYTRDRGFIGYVPHRSLQAVIVAAGARLFVNPEQMTYYSAGDYSERPATMTGWTSAELGVLRRFRKVYA